MRNLKKRLEGIVYPDDFTGIGMEKQDGGIQHIDYLVEVLMLKGLIDADIFINFINLVESLVQFPYVRLVILYHKTVREISIFYGFGEFKHLFHEKPMAGNEAIG